MKEKAATVQDVARVAGVSTATVSRALSHPAKVSEATRKLVAQAVKSTGYRVNRAARNLRTRRANSVLVLLPDLANPFFSDILEGISEHLSAAGISMLVSGTDQLRSSGDALTDYFDDGRADGLIILDGGLSRETLRALEASPGNGKIIFACEWANYGNFPSVRSENRKGAEAAIRHLYDLGHRKIGHVMGPQNNVLTHARKDSALSELTRLGVPPRNDWVIPGDFSLQAGLDAARHWLSLTDRPTALFCSSDILAFGVISELARHGINVPGDVSVMGFDDIDLAEHFIPPLTSIRQDRHALGLSAARMLTDRLPATGDHSRQQIHAVPVALVTRDSTAAPTAR